MERTKIKMIKNGTYILETLGEIKPLSPESSLMRLKFKDIEEEAVMFGNYKESLFFIGKTVIVEFREEYIEGQIMSTVNNLTVMNQVTVLDRKENLKLYTDFDFSTGSNIVFQNLNEGDLIEKAIMYCKEVKFESSAKATWAKLTVIDKNRRVGYLRVFDYDERSEELAGGYIKCSMRVTKYGFVATDIYVAEGIGISANPQVAIAKEYILSVVQEDEHLQNFVNQYDLINRIENYAFEEGEEVGMLLVRLAIELSFINETENLSNQLDLELLRRLAVAKKAYVVNTPATSTYSKELQALIVVTTNQHMSRDRKILCCMDDEENSPFKLIEREYYKHVESLAKTIIAINGPEGYVSTLEGIKRK